MAGKPEPVKLVFVEERKTKNKVRFQEMDPPEGKADAKPTTKDRAAVEKLYVSQALLKKLGEPDTLHVTIEVP